MTADVFAAPAPEIGRDRWGRPLVTPPGGGKAVAYTRCTTYVSALEDTYNLGRWRERMVALGLADRPDLLLSVAAHRDDKRTLNKITDQATEAAKASSAATTGTALHALAERLDRGLPLGVIPDSAARDLAAYEAATEQFDVTHIERLMVCDDLRVAGTPDRIVTFDGERYIADIKTGSLEWGAGKIAMQLAMYSRSALYDIATGRREPLHDLSLCEGIVIHLPAGQHECTLHWVDLSAGWEGVELAGRVRAWRGRKDLLTEFTPAPPSTVAAPSWPERYRAASPDQRDEIWARMTWPERIQTCDTVPALTDLWQKATAAGEWGADLLLLCQERKAQINEAQ